MKTIILAVIVLSADLLAKHLLYTRYNDNIYILVGSAILENICAGIILFVLFGSIIVKELTSHGLEEILYFDENKYFDEIRVASRSVIILESFLETVLDVKKKNHLKFQAALEQLIKNARISGNKCEIKILLLNPDSLSATRRMLELKEYYTKSVKEYKGLDEQEYLKKMRRNMHKWLNDLNDVKVNAINNVKSYFKGTDFSDSDLEFQIRLYDTNPHFSLYTYDSTGFFGYFMENIPTTKNSQLKCRDLLGSPFGKNNLEKFSEIWGLEKSKNIETYIESQRTIEATGIINRFNSLADSNNDKNIASLVQELLEIQHPANLTDNALFYLVENIEMLCKTQKYNYKHYGIFGTGGDKFKTINVSSIVAILASNYNDSVRVVKTGTIHVSSLYGSQEFFDCYKKNIKLINNRKAIFNTNSCFVGLAELGYQYNQKLIEARQELFKIENALDIYKIICPAANLTNSSGQVVGVSKKEYIPYFEKIALRYNRNMIIVHSVDYNSDEILAGKNRVIHIFNGHRHELVVNIKRTTARAQYDNFFAESNDIETHFTKFLQIVNGEVSEDIKETFSYNIATVLKLHWPHESLENLASSAYKKFFN